MHKFPYCLRSALKNTSNDNLAIFYIYSTWNIHELVKRYKNPYFYNKLFNSLSFQVYRTVRVHFQLDSVNPNHFKIKN